MTKPIGMTRCTPVGLVFDMTCLGASLMTGVSLNGLTVVLMCLKTVEETDTKLGSVYEAEVI